MAFATGDYDSDLNKVQCAVTFIPTKFNVTVDISGRNITVHKASESSSVHDIDPHHNITHVTMRQLELIANDQTNFYRSTVGDTFNASISDYRTSIMNTTKESMSESALVLKGVENALISLVDDILVACASAQSMVAGFKKPAPTLVYVDAIRVGSRRYIISSACIIFLIIALFIAEAIRMRGWKELPTFDYLDDRMLVVGASKGGRGIAEYAERNMGTDLDHIPIVWRGERVGDVGEISLRTTVNEDVGDICVRGKVVDQGGYGFINETTLQKTNAMEVKKKKRCLVCKGVAATVRSVEPKRCILQKNARCRSRTCGLPMNHLYTGIHDTSGTPYHLAKRAVDGITNYS
jgi:hypothetical protein